MHTVELLEQALGIVQQLGYQIREECVGGRGGGSCVLRGHKWFFLDPSLDLPDQLELACETLLSDPGVHQVDLPPQLRELLGIRRSA